MELFDLQKFLNSKMPGKGAGKANDKKAVSCFADFCAMIKGKCDDLKDESIPFNDAIEDLSTHFKSESTKMSDTEKTAVNVMNLLLPVLDVLVTNRRDDQHNRHEVKINRLEAGVRSNEYANDNLCQYSRRDNIRISGVPEVAGDVADKNLLETLSKIGAAMNIEVD